MPASRQGNLTLNSQAARQTAAWGALLGELLREGDLVCLCGELGAGKTVFSRGIGQGWGAASPLTSPTYNLVHEHGRAGGGRLYHIDLYRIDGADQAQSLGLEDILADAAVVIVEWAGNMGRLLPSEHLRAQFALGCGDQRQLRLCAQGARHLRLLADFAAAIAKASQLQE